MKLLYITSLSGRRVNGFMKSSIEAAHQTGFEFVMACNTYLADKEQYEKDCREYDITVKHIDFQRNPLDTKNNKAYKQLYDMMRFEKFDAIHCNTPVGGVIGRLCAKKIGIRNIVYQAHGFHFWKGAPIKNWLIYYPTEKILSRYTDILITISKDDYELAHKLKAKRIEYVHGVGVDFGRFNKRDNNDRNLELRLRLGIPKDAKVLLSVGELNKNKNHKLIIDAVSKIDPTVYYVICGDGELRDEYERYISKKGLTERIRLVGYRFDIPEFYRMADLFVFPSLREGIPGAVMEAIATGVPVIASDIRGVRDIVPDKAYRFDPTEPTDLAKLIVSVLDKDNTENLKLNLENLKPYEYDQVVAELKKIYSALV